MTFRDKLIGTVRVLQPVLDEPGVLVVGSEVPNLLQPNAHQVAQLLSRLEGHGE